MAKSIGCDGRIVPLKVRTLKETCVVTYEVMTSQMASLLGTFGACMVPLYTCVLVVTCVLKLQQDIPGLAIVLITALLILPATVVAAIVPRALAHITACHFLGQKTSMRETLSVSLRVVLRVLATMVVLTFVVVAWAFLGLTVVFIVYLSVLLARNGKTDLKDPSDNMAGVLVFLVAYGLSSIVMALFMLYLRARYVFSFVVSAVEPRHWGFSALGRSAELMQGFYVSLVLAVIGSLVCEVPLFLLKLGISHSLAMLVEQGGFLWFLLTFLGGAVFMCGVVIVKAAIGVFFTIFYFSARCQHAKGSTFDHETLAALIHGTETSGVEFGYSILGLESEAELLNEKTLDP